VVAVMVDAVKEVMVAEFEHVVAPGDAVLAKTKQTESPATKPDPVNVTLFPPT